MQNRALYRLASFIRMDSGIDSYGVGSIGLSIPADGCVAGTARAPVAVAGLSLSSTALRLRRIWPFSFLPRYFTSIVYI